MTSIAALVVSLPERHHLLIEALDSIRAQTRQPDDVVVGIDPYRYGEVRNMNRLIDSTDCEWVAFLHDDDVWENDHLAVAEPLMVELMSVVLVHVRMTARIGLVVLDMFSSTVANAVLTPESTSGATTRPAMKPLAVFSL